MHSPSLTDTETGPLHNVPLTPDNRSFESPIQTGYQYGRCFKHLKKNACSLCMSTLTLSFPAAIYYISDELIHNKELELQVRLAGTCVDIILVALTIAGTLFIVKKCCTAIKKGCAAKNTLLLQQQIS